MAIDEPKKLIEKGDIRWRAHSISWSGFIPNDHINVEGQMFCMEEYEDNIKNATKRAELVLSKTSFDKNVDIIVTGDEVKKGKPDPEIFLVAVNKLKVKLEEIIVIEDAASGVRAAKSVGMLCIAKDNRGGSRLKGSRFNCEKFRRN
ncbi:MAG: hypothetical protein COV69_02845 [Parcubacteria group bacterium CG11_big_fil_rev_8_21_14_0_20_39_14]|nr:MAG: hypothetical protein COV69_02845 [Parcubacteria group bacterium CG11_big_fil_rev_8_21_14_0_20_39_14]PIS35381.1 MAG: hypothetical protein COT36_02660 [Parcubacteria group bacterium CG08_land_8_20_14_0_20_38_56]